MNYLLNKNLSDVAIMWIINLTTLTGLTWFDVEVVLKVIVLLATLVYTGLKIFKMLSEKKVQKKDSN